MTSDQCRTLDYASKGGTERSLLVLQFIEGCKGGGVTTGKEACRPRPSNPRDRRTRKLGVDFED
jgi:hypothetical protein